MERRVISLLVENHFGVLTRVTNLDNEALILILYRLVKRKILSFRVLRLQHAEMRESSIKSNCNWPN